MENETPDSDSYTVQSFATDVAQTAAVTVGVAVGFVVVGLAIGKFQEFRNARDAKKLATAEA